MWCQVSYFHFTHTVYIVYWYTYTVVAVKLKQTYIFSATLALWLLWCTGLFWPTTLHLILFCVYMCVWMLHCVTVSVYWFKCWSVLTMTYGSIETHVKTHNIVKCKAVDQNNILHQIYLTLYWNIFSYSIKQIWILAQGLIMFVNIILLILHDVIGQ